MFDEINNEISALEEFYKKVQPLDVKFQRRLLVSEVRSSNRMFLKPERKGTCDGYTAFLTPRRVLTPGNCRGVGCRHLQLSCSSGDSCKQ